jgi:hypothetical protein
VDAKELDDGLEILGKPLSELVEGVNVHCYNDHRVAMSFSVLGTVVKGTVIEEKRCVEKTWPSWWDELERNVTQKFHWLLSAQLTPSLPDRFQTRRHRSSSVLFKSHVRRTRPLSFRVYNWHARSR